MLRICEEASVRQRTYNTDDDADMNEDARGVRYAR